MMHTLFVINPFSGRRDKSDLKQLILASARKHNFEAAFYYTTGKNDAKKLRELIDSENPERIIAVGGDGTCNMVAKEAWKTKKTMGIIPMGSANGLARELEIQANVEESLRIISLNKTKKIDMLRINQTHISLHLSDIGFNARVIERFEKDTVRGMLGYAKHYLKELRNYHSFKISVQPESKKKRRFRVSMLVMANASKYGTGALINPTGSINDGQLELILIRPYSFRHVLHILWSLLSGTLHKLQYVKIMKGKKFTILNYDKQPIQIDGELIVPQKRITVEIIPQELRVLVP